MKCANHNYQHNLYFFLQWNIRYIFSSLIINFLCINTVSLENNGGFIQMATDLALDPSIQNTVNAKKYDGIEIDVLFQDPKNNDKLNTQSQTFNLHLRNDACLRQFSSYRSTFVLDEENQWFTIRLPWSEFAGYGPGSDATAFDESTLRRVGILAIGKEMEVMLAISGIRFYSVL